ncbi:MAG: histidine phosphatase family protein [Ruminococcaceae bacterium]|nr:histidine phosphatase family protein [Oscillospiraceae bacterium]
MSQIKRRTLKTTPVVLMQPSAAAHILLEGRTLVCLARHGQTDWNLVKRLQGHENVPLNAMGHSQAEILAGLVTDIKNCGVSFAAVCTSPLDRAHETAKYVSKALGLGDPIVVERLIERDYGSLSGLTLEERIQKYPRGERQAGDVEVVPVAAKRMLRAIDDMLEVSDRKTVVGVTHGGIINAVFSRLTQGEIGTGKTLSVNCGLSLVAAGIGEAVPIAFNLQGENAVQFIKKMIHFGAEL